MYIYFGNFYNKHFLCPFKNNSIVWFFKQIFAFCDTLKFDLLLNQMKLVFFISYFNIQNSQIEIS